MNTRETKMLEALNRISVNAEEFPFIKTIADKAIEYNEYLTNLKDANAPEPPQNYYPGIQYQRLFNLISETKGIATLMELDEIITVVHQDFPAENNNPVY